MPKIVTIVGARPQFIKAAVVSRAIRDHNATVGRPSSVASGFSAMTEVLIHTGQHYDVNMSDVFFQELDLPQPDYYLGVGSGNHGEQTAKMLTEIEKVLLSEKPDMVMVYGDTNSTLAGALAASKIHIPVAHVEAGLRSYNKTMPEEINRVLTDHVSSILFCPSKRAVDNLRKEGFANIVTNGNLIDTLVENQESGVKWADDGAYGRLLDYLDFPCSPLPLPNSAVSHPPITNHQPPPLCSSRTADSHPIVLNVGDVMYDLALSMHKTSRAAATIANYGLIPKSFILATIHRPENTDVDSHIRNIFRALNELAKAGVRIFFLVHPRTYKVLGNLGLLNENCSEDLIIHEPIPYQDMIALEAGARLIITDSGGVQKEGYFFNTPCVIPRTETEWTELVHAGYATLCGKSVNDLTNAVHSVLAEKNQTSRQAFYGDGRAGLRIALFIKMTIGQHRSQKSA